MPDKGRSGDRPAAYTLPARVTVKAESQQQAMAALWDVFEEGASVNFEAEHVDHCEVLIAVDPDVVPISDQAAAHGQGDDAWTLARKGYDAFCRFLANAQDNHRYSGPDEPAWEFLDHPVREAWRAAMQEVPDAR